MKFLESVRILRKFNKTRLFIGLGLVLMLGAQAQAATITVVNRDSGGEGLNDLSSATPVPGNSATTRGAQFLNVYRAAAKYWGDILKSDIEIFMDAELSPLPCNASGGTLGQAGPFFVFRNFANAPQSNLWYTSAQADSLANSDLSAEQNPGVSDMGAEFNSSLNGDPNCIGGLTWWLGIDSPAPAGTISFYDTVLHEIGHGLGFLSLTSQNGTYFLGVNDTFSNQLFDVSQNKAWRNMSNAERAASSVNTGSLVWNGANVTNGTPDLNSGKNGNRVRMFAPRPFQGGSSVSHWDIALSPDELMEPRATLTSDDTATRMAFKDIGWVLEGFNAGSIVPIFPLLFDE